MPEAPSTIAGEHLAGGEIGQRDAHRLGGIDAIGGRHNKRRGADRILCVSTDDTEISNQLSDELDRGTPGPVPSTTPTRS